LDGHHIYRSCGGSISAAVGMGEKLLEEGKDEREIAEKFKEQIQHEFPEEGSFVDVEHVKLGGIVFHLGQAIIECIDNERIKYSRIMRSDGYYDGLKVKKEAQDKAESDTKKGDWHIVTKYFSKDGKWKGTYINLNTPVEIYPNAIRYVDLEVDICLLPDGSVRVLDMEKLENALEKGVISKKLFEDAKERVSKIIQANTIQS
jgi:protein associated with RNAse G/E